MNPIDETTLQAYVDGELDPASAARIDAALAHDAVLAHRVQQARAVRLRVREAFAPVLDEPVPERFAALLQPPVAPAPRGTSGRRATAAHRGAGRRWLPGLALAASAVLVAVAVWSWSHGDGLVRRQGNQAIAAGALEHALDHALASEPDARAEVAIGLSFRSSDGRICRTFLLHTPPVRAGLACHGEQGWTLPVLVPAGAPQAGELRQAASALPPPVQDAVDARLHGDVFDARQERAARDAGWR